LPPAAPLLSESPVVLPIHRKILAAPAGNEKGPADMTRRLALMTLVALVLAAPARAQSSGAELDIYIGRYQIAPAIVMTISRDGAHQMAQAGDQPKVELYPDGENEFRLQVVDAQVTFELDARGRATALVLHQLGRDQRALRIEGEPVIPKEIAVAPSVFDRLAGDYELAPGVTMTISRDGTHFYEQLTGQSKFEIFASGEHEYFLKVVDAQIVFEFDSQQRPTALVLHQGGREIRGGKTP
jgi:D-alanyl-D-alanine-carboxypeptidase/D-alanyl-D-alanine-endopeptidase